MSRNMTLAKHAVNVRELPGPPAGDPYCGSCGYPLAGLDDASKCPECGRPLVEVLVRGSQIAGYRAKRYASEAMLFGLPIVSIAFGPRPEFGEKRGVAKGIIAIGDVAIGGIALGGMPIGVVAIGGMGAGGVAIGGMAVGLIAGVGGVAVGGLAAGGAAVGGLAVGGGAIGYVAMGGGAYGVYAAGGGAGGAHVIDYNEQDPAAQQMFKDLSWYFGPAAMPGSTVGSTSAFLMHPLAAIGSIGGVLALAILVVAMVGIRKQRKSASRI